MTIEQKAREIAAGLTDREKAMVKAIPLSEPYFQIGARNRYAHELINFPKKGLTKKIHKTPAMECDRYVMTPLGLAIRALIEEQKV